MFEQFLDEEVSPTRLLEVNQAVWITPDGEKIEVAGEHGKYVKDNPTDFGLTEEDVDGVVHATSLNNMAVRNGAIRIRFSMSMNVKGTLDVTEEAYEQFIRFARVKARDGITNIRMSVLKDNGLKGARPGVVDIRRIFGEVNSWRGFVGRFNELAEGN